jgi:isovaleryl-CoA dehydrogenase
MDFELSEDHSMLKDTVRRYVDKELIAAADKIDDADRIPGRIRKRLSQLGLMGITIPEEYGGAGADSLSTVLVMEELSRGSAAVGMSWMAHAILCGHNICSHGNKMQREKYLPALSSGKAIGALAITEPGAGSDAVGITTTAKKKGREYILNGTKTFITNGPIADVIVLYAKTDPSKRSRGITAFIIEKEFEGFSVSKEIKKMGHKGSPTGQLILEDCRVPEDNVLLSENKGVTVMMNNLDIERTVFAAGAVGVAQAAFEYSVQYADAREQFGQPIGKFQLIQGKLADMYTEIEAARLLVYKAAMVAEDSRRGGKGTEIHKLAAAALLFAGDVGERVTREAVQIFGGYGYTLEFPVNRLYRDAKLYSIGAGTSEVRRIIIARELLKL